MRSTLAVIAGSLLLLAANDHGCGPPEQAQDTTGDSAGQTDDTGSQTDGTVDGTEDDGSASTSEVCCRTPSKPTCATGAGICELDGFKTAAGSCDDDWTEVAMSCCASEDAGVMPGPDCIPGVDPSDPSASTGPGSTPETSEQGDTTGASGDSGPEGPSGASGASGPWGSGGTPESSAPSGDDDGGLCCRDDEAIKECMNGSCASPPFMKASTCDAGWVAVDADCCGQKPQDSDFQALMALCMQ